MGRPVEIPFTAEMQAEIRRRYEAGETLHRLRAAYHTTLERIKEAVVEAGGVLDRQSDPLRQNRYQVPDEELLVALEDHVRGATITELAERYNVHRMTMATYLKHAERLARLQLVP